MLTKYKMVAVILIPLMILLTACTAPQSPISEARKNYLDHDYAQAFHKALKPALRGNAAAQYAIGYMYYYGLGIAKDQDSARLWILKSANQNYAPAIVARKKIYSEKGNQDFLSLT